MGRLSNSNGLRLGTVLPWKFYKFSYLKKGIKFCDLEKYILYLCNNVILNRAFGQVIGFIASDVRFVVKKGALIVCVDVYDVDILESGVKNREARYCLETYLLSLEYLLQKACYRFLNCFVLVEFHVLKQEQLTSDILCSYIQIKLYQGFTLMDIVFSLKRVLRKVKGIVGFRADFKGRFTRRQRASFLSIKAGRVPFSEISSPIMYSEGSAVLKYGKCGFKVWLHKGF